MEKAKPALRVEFYKESTGTEPVRDWLYSLEKPIRVIIGEDIMRVLFLIHRETMVLLHGFIKKTQKLSLQDIKTAKTRARNYEQQEKKR